MSLQAVRGTILVDSVPGLSTEIAEIVQILPDWSRICNIHANIDVHIELNVDPFDVPLHVGALSQSSITSG